MAPICRAIELKLRWCHHVVLSEKRGGSVATFRQMQVLIARLEGVLDTLDMPGVIHRNRMPLVVHNCN